MFLDNYLTVHMKAKVLLFLCALLASVCAQAQYESPPYQPPVEEAPKEVIKQVRRVYPYYGIFGAGASIPFGGHWGDTGSGFKYSPYFVFAGAKRVDDTLSYGIETSYSSGHRNKTVRDMRVRIFSLTPFLRVASLSGETTYFGIVGAGIYQWNRRSYSAAGESFPSDSGSSLGINMGGGAVYPFWDACQIGLELRWHHIFNVQGDQLDVGLVNNIVPSVFLAYGF